MKKKAIIMLLCGTFLLSGCSGKPSGMSDEVYEIGSQALEIIEKYNDAEISEDDAQTRLSMLSDSIDDIKEENPDDLHAVTIGVDISGANLSLSTNGNTYEWEEFLRKDLGK